MSKQRTLILGGTGKAFHVKKNEYVMVTDVDGQQVADFIAINFHDYREYLSTAHTRTMSGNISLFEKQFLYSNYRNKMLQLVKDTVGTHDTLYPCCDSMRYLLDFGVENHRNCRDNFSFALEPYGIEYWRIPDPVNLFQNAPINIDGSFDAQQTAKSKAGDFVVFKALKDLIVAVSACPMDLTPLCGWKISDILIEISNTY